MARKIAQPESRGSAIRTDLIALEGKVSLLTWMIGVNLTLTLLVLGKLFVR